MYNEPRNWLALPSSHRNPNVGTFFLILSASYPRSLLIGILVLGASNSFSQEKPLLQTKGVPRVQAIPQPDHSASFQIEGREVTRLHFGPEHRRVFLFPVYASRDVSLTRIGHPHDPWGHSHHNSVWMSHFQVDGVDFWGDRGSRVGKVELASLPREAFQDSDQSASVTLYLQWRSESNGVVLLKETRMVSVYPMPSAASWLLVVDALFTAPKDRTVVLGATPFGMAAVRMAKSIGVHDGGGRIMNSVGQWNEKEVFRKPAAWVDYSGRITNEPDGFGGITLLNHPKNPSHPTPFHVRDDGWMGACLNLDQEIRVSADKPLKLRYGYWVHDGVPVLADIEMTAKSFNDLPEPNLLTAP